MSDDNKFSGIGMALEWAEGVARLVFLIWLISYPFKEAIKSWRAKDENYRADCIVLPIAGMVLVVGMVGLGILCLLFPDWAMGK